MKTINENIFPNFDDSYELTANICEDLEDFIEDLFLKYQDVLKIDDGGVSPIMVHELDMLTDHLAEHITDILNAQKTI